MSCSSTAIVWTAHKTVTRDCKTSRDRSFVLPCSGLQIYYPFRIEKFLERILCCWAGGICSALLCNYFGFFSAFHICLSLVGSTHDAEGRCTLPTMRGFMSWCTTSYSICNEYENNMKNRLRVSKNSVYSHTSQPCGMEMRKRVEQRRKVGSAHSQPTFYHPARLLLPPHNNGKSLQIPLEN